MTAEGYDLKWKDHLPEVFSVVQKLRTRESFADVIVHSGGKNFFAHKVILAASSKFFERLLSNLPRARGDSSVLVMAETPPDLLKMVMDFIYDGETFVTSEQLNEFLEVAERLEIRGLGKSGASSKEVNQNQGGKSKTIVDSRKRVLEEEEEEEAVIVEDDEEESMSSEDAPPEPVSAAKRPREDVPMMGRAQQTNKSFRDLASTSAGAAGLDSANVGVVSIKRVPRPVS